MSRKCFLLEKINKAQSLKICKKNYEYKHKINTSAQALNYKHSTSKTSTFMRILSTVGHTELGVQYRSNGGLGKAQRGMQFFIQVVQCQSSFQLTCKMLLHRIIMEHIPKKLCPYFKILRTSLHFS